jgi:copper chaperone
MLTTTRLRIEGMTCGHCKAAVENALRGQAGVRSATVDLQAGAAEVQHEEGGVDAGRLVAAVREEGYEAAVA